MRLFQRITSRLPRTIVLNRQDSRPSFFIVLLRALSAWGV
jgi:hypothetical protein